MGHSRSQRIGWRRPTRGGAVFVLLLGTFTGTLTNNIVNVPIRSIAQGNHVALATATLIVTAFNLSFAILMPLTGWLGDRVGRRRVFCWAVLTIAAGSAGAIVAPNIGSLVICRVVQGAGTAAVLPTVMGMLSQLFASDQRGRVLGAWAAMNGLGRAVSAPLGGYIASTLGWRWVFAPAVPLAALAFVGSVLLVPESNGQRLTLDWRGAVLLTGGSGLLIAGATAVPIASVVSVPVIGLSTGGLLLLALFTRSTKRRSDPFINPRLLREPSYFRSTLAAFAQMFCLSVALLAAPLYLTHSHRMTVVAARVVVFVLPAVMVVLGPGAGWIVEKIGARRVLRVGMTVLILGEVLMASALSTGRASTGPVIAALLVIGAGAALVQTPAAVGATRSAAGQRGTGLGLYNMVRFSGAALGAAWVGMALGLGYGFVFSACAVVAAAGLVGTWAGSSPAVR